MFFGLTNSPVTFQTIIMRSDKHGKGSKISIMQIQQTSGDNTNYGSKYIEIQLKNNESTYQNSVTQFYGG